MKQMNNKGQVLVLFAILLPILLLLLISTIEIASLYLDKTKTKNTIKNIITENLKNYNENTNIKINTLIEQNINDIEEKTIFISEDEIRINITQKKIFFGRNLKIEYKYKGYKQEQKIKIEEG